MVTQTSEHIMKLTVIHWIGLKHIYVVKIGNNFAICVGKHKCLNVNGRFQLIWFDRWPFWLIWSQEQSLS